MKLIKRNIHNRLLIYTYIMIFKIRPMSQELLDPPALHIFFLIRTRKTLTKMYERKVGKILAKLMYLHYLFGQKSENLLHLKNND